MSLRDSAFVMGTNNGRCVVIADADEADVNVVIICDSVIALDEGDGVVIN